SSLAWSRPFGWISATYCTLPLTFSGPSGRGIDSPTPLTSRVVFITVAMRSSFRADGGARGRARRLGDRLDHLRVAGAPAEVAGDRVANVVVGGPRILGDQCRGGHQHTGDAEPALRYAVPNEGVLQWRERAATRQPLDRRHGPPARLHRQHEAARHEVAIQMDGARAAVAGAAAFLWAGEAEILAERVEQRDVRRHEHLDGLAVHGEAQNLLGHDATSLTPSRVRARS